MHGAAVDLPVPSMVWVFVHMSLPVSHRGLYFAYLQTDNTIQFDYSTRQVHTTECGLQVQTEVYCGYAYDDVGLLNVQHE